MSNVNDDEDIAMADDLLDLELDTMILSQSTHSNMVSQVPYKKIRDSQTSNSRLSPELCCKDQLRSNHNSTLLDDTRSPTSPGMPSYTTQPYPTTHIRIQDVLDNQRNREGNHVSSRRGG